MKTALHSMRNTIIALFGGSAVGVLILCLNRIFVGADSSSRSIFMILLSALAIVVTFTYVLKNRNNISIFSPYFFPLVIFSTTYVIPSIRIGIIRGNAIVEMALCLQVVGIGAYLLGAMLHKLYEKKYNPVNQIGKTEIFIVAKQQKMIMKSFFILGLLLLIIYGLISGVTMGFLRRLSVEGLRRSAEIGKGIVKEPGVFFTTISALWLLGLNFAKKEKIRIVHLMFIFSICFLIFITTGHISQPLWVLLFAVGLYSKYYKISLFKLLAFGLLLLTLIGLMGISRSLGNYGFSKIIGSSFVLDSTIYEVNYLALVRLVNLGALNLQYGKEYLQNATIMIPRFLWLNKPLNFDYFLKDVLDLHFVGGGAPATVFGSLYINFGFAGVAIGMTFIGFFYRSLYQIHIKKHDLLMTIITLYMFPAIISPDIFLPTILLLVFLIVVMLAINKICSGAIKNMQGNRRKFSIIR